jgi:hypothetical protein
MSTHVLRDNFTTGKRNQFVGHNKNSTATTVLPKAIVLQDKSDNTSTAESLTSSLSIAPIIITFGIITNTKLLHMLHIYSTQTLPHTHTHISA